MSALTTAQFLQELYRGCNKGYAEIRCIHVSGDESKARKMYRALPVGEINQSGLDRLSAMNNEYHIYHRTAISTQQRSRKRDISAVPAIWLDIDDPSQSAFDRIFKMDIHPSIVVHSGGGYHAYWMLDRPQVIHDKDTMHDIERTMQGMILAYGDGTDVKTKDITRILRTPGFHNIKDKYGYEKPIAKAIYFTETRHQFDDLHDLYAPLGTPPQPKIKRHIPSEALNSSLPSWVQSWLKNPHIKGRGRNHTLYAIARAYVDAYMPQSSAEIDLIPLAQSLHGDHPLTRQECLATIASAYKNQPNVFNQLPSHMSHFMAVEDTLRS